MKTPSFISNRIRAIVVGATAVSLIAPAILFAGAAQAKSVRCDEAGQCKTYCTQKLPNGSIVEYEEGTNIIITDPDGKEYKFTCKNGDWVKARLVIRGSGLLAQPVGGVTMAR